MKLIKFNLYVIYKETIAKVLTFATALLVVSCSEHETTLNSSFKQSQAFEEWTLTGNDNRPSPLNGPTQYAHKTSKSGKKTVDTFMWCSGARIQIQIQLNNGVFSSTPIYNPKEEKWLTGFYTLFVNDQDIERLYALAVQDIFKKNVYNFQLNNEGGIPKTHFQSDDWFIKLQFSDRKNLNLHLNDIDVIILKLCGT
jgi:hypothetical protein